MAAPQWAFRMQISRAVEEWQPQAESIPLHVWLHPWLPWLGPRLETLYLTVRYRLSTALQAWHPSDASAFALLSPWHKVRMPELGPGAWRIMSHASALALTCPLQAQCAVVSVWVNSPNSF